MSTNPVVQSIKLISCKSYQSVYLGPSAYLAVQLQGSRMPGPATLVLTPEEFEGHDFRRCIASRPQPPDGLKGVMPLAQDSPLRSKGDSRGYNIRMLLQECADLA